MYKYQTLLYTFFNLIVLVNYLINYLFNKVYIILEG